MPYDQPARRPEPDRRAAVQPDRSLQILLWAAWTLAVTATAYLTWHAAALAGHPMSRVALVVHCVLAGTIGLLVITWVEIRLAGWR